MQKTSNALDALNRNRAYLILALVLIFALFTPRFYTMFNVRSILSGSALYTFLGVSFTLCLIAGHMDLSVGYMATTGAMVVLGMRTNSGLPWWLAILIAVGVGAIAGTINGLLVTKAKIHSFIATLGMQFVLRGSMYMYCNGAEISVRGEFTLTDAINRAPLKFLPLSNLFICTLAVVIIYLVVLRNTRFGRNVHIMGGNRETAWLAGVKSDKLTTLVFTLSGITCALGGALFAISQGTATPTLGEKGIPPLMVALTATILGGTSMAGGKGNVLKTFASILAIMAMLSVLTTRYGKFELQILFMGLALAVAVIYETLRNYARQKRVGIRPNLADEYARETGKTLHIEK
ncbi:MAG TPA: ABC transporter permease [Clostridiaceae bacterium]|jgi:ribose/xylose/arabinose/galactoside ABC-type transport system permease subunit|nr:ABC transporter permease [Clostridiaceae bacterium]